MAKAKLARRRSRRPGAVTRSKSSSGPKQVSIRRSPERFPPDLRAPITADVERQLKELVAQFGEKKVREALDPLITKCKWRDWQCVANAIRRIARQR